MPTWTTLLDGLDATQRDAVTSRAAPLAILAGAGSGKTRVLTRRIAWQAREGLDRSRATCSRSRSPARPRASCAPGSAASACATSVTAGTFHAIALAQLRRRGRRAGPRHARAPRAQGPRPRAAASPARGREAALARRRARGRDRVGEGPARQARRLRAGGRRRRAHHAAPAGRGRRRLPRYEREKRKRGLVDFDDLISGCADALERDAEFAAAQRWRFRHLFVDEFQDASAAQFRLLRAWLGDRTDLCVVGDPRPGDLRVRRRRPVVPRPASGAGSRPSTSPTSASSASAATTGRRPRSSRPRARCSAPPGRRRPRCTRRSPTVPSPSHRVRHRRGRGARRRAARCATPSARDLPWSRMAVLYRVNAQSALFEEAFARAGVPFRVRGGGRFLDRPEVKVALDALRKTARDGADPPVRRAPHRPRRRRRRPRRGAPRARRRARAPRATSTSRPTAARGTRRRLPRVPPDVAARRRRRRRRGRRGRAAHVPPGQGPRVRHRVRHRARAGPRADLARQDLRGARRGAAAPLRRAEPRRARAAPELGPRAHGRRPHRQAQPEQLARPGRRRRAPGAADRPTGPTATRAGASPTPATASPGRAAAARAAKAPPRSPAADAPLYDALVDWRLRQSRAASAPAYVIFHNTTLAGHRHRPAPRARGRSLDVPGVGPVKAERYGEAVLALVAEHTRSAPASRRADG